MMVIGWNDINSRYGYHFRINDQLVVSQAANVMLDANLDQLAASCLFIYIF